MIINRHNSMGLLFQLCARSRNETSICLIGTEKKIVVNVPIEEMSQRWYNWQMKGQHIQVAFDNLSADQREFFLTGITKEEWDAIFGEEEEE